MTGGLRINSVINLLPKSRHDIHGPIHASRLSWQSVYNVYSQEFVIG